MQCLLNTRSRRRPRESTEVVSIREGAGCFGGGKALGEGGCQGSWGGDRCGLSLPPGLLGFGTLERMDSWAPGLWALGLLGLGALGLLAFLLTI